MRDASLIDCKSDIREVLVDHLQLSAAKVQEIANAIAMKVAVAVDREVEDIVRASFL